MSYKIIKDDKKFYQVMHPDGTKFTVPKGGLSKEMKSKIDGLEKHFDGAEIDRPQYYEMTPEERIEANRIAVGMPSQADIAANNLSQDAYKLALAEQMPMDRDPLLMGTPVPSDIGRSVAMNTKPEVDAVIEDTAKIPESPSNNISDFESLSKPSVPSFNPNSAMYMSQAAGQELGEAQKVGQAAIENNAADFTTKMKQLSDRGQEIANQKQDQGRLWNNTSTGNKVLAALSVALGGIGSGMTGKSNLALDAINKAIDRDIEAQKDDKNSLYNAYLQEYKNSELAHTATQAALMNKVQMAKDNYTAKITDAKMLQESQKIGIDLAKANAEIGKKGQGQMAMSLLLPKAINGTITPQEREALNVAMPGAGERIVNGQGIANDPKIAAEANAFGAARNNAQRVIGELKQIASKPYASLSPNDKARAELLVAELGSAIGPMLIGPSKSYTEGDAKRLEQLMKNPSNIFSLTSSFTAAADQLMRGADGYYGNLLRSGGITPRLPSYQPAQTGGKLPLNSASYKVGQR